MAAPNNKPRRPNRTLFQYTCEQCESEFYRRRLPEGKGRFCSNLCARTNRNSPIDQRFWRRVNQNGPIVRPELGPCWVWNAGTTVFGYGIISRTLTHRFSWKLHNGTIPANTCVLHRCDNPPCIRPEHLFLGTKKSNAIDMAQKGRQRNQVLSTAQIREIRARYSRGGITWKTLGLEYHVTTHHIGNIIHRRVGRHVE